MSTLMENSPSRRLKEGGAGSNKYLGKKCLVISSNGSVKVGIFMGLSDLGTKQFAEFESPSGSFNRNVSYLEGLELLEVESE